MRRRAHQNLPDRRGAEMPAAGRVGGDEDVSEAKRLVFQAFDALLDEGDAALDRIARFVKDNTVHKVAT